MASTARDIITAALEHLLVYGAAQPISDEDAAKGFRQLNRLVSRFATQRLTIFTVTGTTYPLMANTQSYTIGPGGDFNQARPLWIEGFGVIPNRNAVPLVEYPRRRLLTLEEYKAIAIKGTTSSFPYEMYYDYGFTGAGLGRVFVFPVPSVNHVDVTLYTPTAMQAFADLDTSYEFPPGYEEMLEFNLCKPLAPSFQTGITAEVAELARETLEGIKYANVRIPPARFDAGLPGRRGRADIRTNGWR